MLTVILIPLFSLSCNFVLCHGFPIWGNYITLAAAAGLGLTTTGLLWLIDYFDNTDLSTKNLSRGLAVLAGCGVAAVLSFPVALKLIVAATAQSVTWLLAFSKL